MNAPASGGKVCLVNGSLRGQKASSAHFLNRVGKLLAARNIGTAQVSVRPRLPHGYPEEILAALNSADAVILAFPLYCYCLPGGLMRLLEEWARYAMSHPIEKRPRVYGIANCGFVLPETNTEAVGVLKHFCARLGLHWRFAIEIACGPAVVATELIDIKLRRALKSVATDIQSGSTGPKGDVLIGQSCRASSWTPSESTWTGTR